MGTEDQQSIVVRDLSVTYRSSIYAYSSFKEWILKRRKAERIKEIKALKDISLSVRRGEALALLGHNGCGKSTLLKAIAGIIVPKKATVQVEGRIAPMIELGSGFDGELSGRENIRLSCTLMGLSKTEIDERVDAIIAFSELEEFIELPLKTYSSGMYARLGFACATAIEPNVLLIDEILAVGDRNFGRRCLDRIHELQQTGTTIVLVSHDENAVRQFCDRGLVLSDGKIKYDGPVASALSKHQDLMEERRLSRLPAPEREAIVRLNKLRREEQADDRDKPELRCSLRFCQDGSWVTTIDCAMAFTIHVFLRISETSLVRPPLSIGLGVNLESGQRIGGCNNLDLNRDFPELASDCGAKELECVFNFSRGIPEIGAGVYKVYVGVHDQRITRSLLMQHVGDFSFVNTKLGPNTDGDIFSLSSYVNSIAFSELKSIAV